MIKKLCVLLLTLIFIFLAGCGADTPAEKSEISYGIPEAVPDNLENDEGNTDFSDEIVPENGDDISDEEHAEKSEHISEGEGRDNELESSYEQIDEPEDDEFVMVTDYITEIYVELMYATDYNFTGQAIYSFTNAYLRYGTVKKLAAAQDLFEEYGYYLKIWDAFRPVEAQFDLWEVCPDPRYVANPEKGYSSHSRGNTVDVTLVDGEGNELIMPTGFDDFTELANRDYSDVEDEQAAENARLLENIMVYCGFSAYFGEWWHFSDTETYSVEIEFIPDL